MAWLKKLAKNGPQYLKIGQVLPFWPKISTTDLVQRGQDEGEGLGDDWVINIVVLRVPRVSEAQAVRVLGQFPQRLPGQCWGNFSNLGIVNCNSSLR